MAIRNPPIDASLAQYRELLRGDLQTFIQRCFMELNPHAILSLNWAPGSHRGQTGSLPPW